MQTIGDRLEEARKRKGVTIREAAEATKIRGEYLNSFENNNFGINVPEIYVRGFLRSYSNFLKVNSDKVITDYNATLIGEAKAAKRDHREFFGRMELQQPLISENPATDNDEDRAAPKEDKFEEPRPGPFAFLSNIANIEREVAIKVGIIAAIALICILLLVWIFSMITSSDEAPANTMEPATSSQSETMTPAPSVETQTIRLFAKGDVRVTVTERNSGRVLLNLHPMSAGQSVPVTKQGPVRIEYTAGENLEVEVNGTRYQTGKTGQSFSTIP